MTAGNPSLTEFFKKLVGAKFTVDLDKNYKVEKVEGKDAFIASLGAGSPQMDTLLKKIMTDDALKQMCDPTFGLVPPTPPKKAGETWKRETHDQPRADRHLRGDLQVQVRRPGRDKKDMDKIEVETSLVYTAPKDERRRGCCSGSRTAS